jgi:galactokinase
MMGGGFGGCTINIVNQNHSQDVIEQAEKIYQLATGKPLTHYFVSIEDGADFV